MWGNVLIALIALVGVLLPVFWGTGQLARDRKALKEEADLLAALPQTGVSKRELERHLEEGVKAYVANSMVKDERRDRKMMRGFFAATVVGCLLALPVLFLRLNGVLAYETSLMLMGVLAVVTYVFLGAAMVYWRRVRQARAGHLDWEIVE